MKVIAIIPARYASTRLPNKLLLEIHGQSILSRVYHKAIESDVFDEVIIAADHQKIVEHCSEEKLNVVLTDENHISGTDRVAEVASNVPSDVVINIQGDEPFIEVECIQALVSLMKKDYIHIGTLYKEITEPSSLFDYNNVKLVTGLKDKILYFSRQAIPSLRDKPYKEWLKTHTYFQHLGLYGFKRETLLGLVKLTPSSLELAEKLEQLRWIENGFTIYGEKVKSKSFGIDTEEDLEKARMIYK